MTAAEGLHADQQQVVPSTVCRGLFIVPVTWKGGSADFILDTGARTWSMDPDALERIRGKRYAMGKKVTLRKGEAGPLQIRKVKVLVHEFDHLSLALGREVDGIMGFNTFRKVLLTLDYPAAEVRVMSGKLPDVDEVDVFADLGKHRPYLRFSLGSAQVPVLVDSGSTSGLKLHEDDPLHWLFEPTMVHVSVRFAHVELRHAGRLQSEYALGPLTLVEPITAIGDSTRLVGAQFLQHLALTFDQQNHRIRMRASGDTRIESEPYRSLGLGLRPRRTGMEVTGVFKGTPAADAGIMKGDLVTHIDDQFVHDRACGDIEQGRLERRKLTMERNGERIEVDVEPAILVP